MTFTNAGQSHSILFLILLNGLQAWRQRQRDNNQDFNARIANRRQQEQIQLQEVP